MKATGVVMGTIVTIEVVTIETASGGAAAPIARAMDWFHAVEACCTRFDTSSELMQLCARPGEAVAASRMLFEAVRFAVAVAAETGGAFDPTVGAAMAARGFDREHRTGAHVATLAADPAASWRDIELDDTHRTILLRRPLTLDLGGIAKGLAIDAAARELQPLEDFAIDAGGDLYLGGRNAHGEPWSVAIRHPRAEDAAIETLRVSNRAVCTSGDYERRSPAATHDVHIVDPRDRTSAAAAISATVIAPHAMLADALATAAFVLGPDEGLRLLDRHGVEGLIVAPDLRRIETRGLRHT